MACGACDVRIPVSFHLFAPPMPRETLSCDSLYIVYGSAHLFLFWNKENFTSPDIHGIKRCWHEPRVLVSLDLTHPSSVLQLTRDICRPLRLFANRTSAIVFANTFIMSMLNYWIFFFLPLYFQAIQLSTPTRSGVQILPVTLIAIPGAAVAGVTLAKVGRYTFLTAGFGSLSVLDKDSSMAAWVCLQILPSIGAGMVLDTMLPAFQAGVSEVDSAAAAAGWSFMRSFGNIWGVAIPGAIFNTCTSRYATYIFADPSASLLLQNGNAYSSATQSFVESFSEPTRSQIIEVFTRALSKVFLISTAFPGLAFILAFFEREIKLRTELETEFGLEEREAGKP